MLLCLLEAAAACEIGCANGGEATETKNGTDSFAQIAASRGVVTVNSSMGLQSFFHDRPVITLGRAFFALPGLVTPAADQQALNSLFASPGALAYDAALRAAFPQIA